MKKYAPLPTLVAVAVLGGGLLVANSLATPPTRPSPRPRPPSAARRADEPAAPRPSPPPPPAPPAAPAVAEKAFTGRSSGNEVTVAIAVKDGRAVAYVCDGKKIEAWLEGTLVGDQLSLTGKTQHHRHRGRQGGVGHRRGRRQAVAVRGQGRASPAGLYEGRGNVRGVATRIGWIVEGNGRVTGRRVGERHAGARRRRSTRPPRRDQDRRRAGLRDRGRRRRERMVAAERAPATCPAPQPAAPGASSSPSASARSSRSASGSTAGCTSRRSSRSTSPASPAARGQGLAGHRRVPARSGAARLGPAHVRADPVRAPSWIGALHRWSGRRRCCSPCRSRCTASTRSGSRPASRGCWCTRCSGASSTVPSWPRC